MQKIEIIKAQKKDADAVIRLMLEALGDYASFIVISDNYNVTLERLKKCFVSEKVNQFHYSNCFMAVINNEVVGACSAYSGKDIKLFNKNLSSIIAEFKVEEEKINHVLHLLKSLREADKDEYYMDTLCIKKEYRKQKISSLLIKEVSKKATLEGFSKLAIVVQEGKEGLLDYYKKQKFHLEGVKNLGEINYYHLIKKLV